MYAIVSKIYSHNPGSKEIPFEKGHTTQLSFDVPTEGGLIVLGEVKVLK